MEEPFQPPELTSSWYQLAWAGLFGVHMVLPRRGHVRTNWLEAF